MYLRLFPVRASRLSLLPNQRLCCTSHGIHRQAAHMYSIHLEPELHAVTSGGGVPQEVGIQAGRVTRVAPCCLDVNVVTCNQMGNCWITLYIVWLSLIWDTDWLNTVTWSTNISVCCPPQSCGGGTLIDTTHFFMQTNGKLSLRYYRFKRVCWPS